MQIDVAKHSRESTGDMDIVEDHDAVAVFCRWLKYKRCGAVVADGQM